MAESMPTCGEYSIEVPAPKDAENRNVAPAGMSSAPLRIRTAYTRDRCIKANDSCRYYSTSGICSKCTRPDNDGGGCMTVVFGDIKRRIRKLRGGDE